MAVPKKKTSQSRRNMRRSHHALKPAGLCRMPELRRAQAAASCVPVLRPLRRPRGDARRARKRPEQPAARGRAAVSDGITIALDAMGGDRAPDMVLKGADIALQRFPELRFLLFGDESELEPLLAQAAAPRQARRPSTIPTRWSPDDAKPSLALRTGPAIQHAAGDRRGRRRARPTASSRPAIPAR